MKKSRATDVTFEHIQSRLGAIPYISKSVEVEIEEKWSFLHWKPSDNIFLNFLRESSVHGLRYLGELNTNLLGRIFWFISVSSLLCASVYSMATMISKYYNNPIIVSYKPLEIGLDQIPFPAITVCNVNNMRKSAVLKIQEQYSNFTPGTPEHIESEEALGMVYHVCEMHETFSKSLNLTGGAKKPATWDFFENYYENASDAKFKKNKLLKNAFQSCADMIILCIWQGERMSPEVCDSLFREVFTDFGSCCVFNMIPVAAMRDNVSLFNQNGKPVEPELIKKWKEWDIDQDLIDTESGDIPQHQRRAGKRSGLSLLLNPELEEYYCPSTDSIGFRMTAASPIDFPKIMEFGFGIPPNSEVFVDLRPELTMADKNIHDVPLEKRNCYFSSNKEYRLRFYNFYSVKNCLQECITNITLERCGCVKNYMPRDPLTTLLCGDISMSCATETFDDLVQEGMHRNCSVCLPSCTQINYSYGISVLPMTNERNIWIKENIEAPWSYKNVTEVHVYFGSDTIYSRLRQRLYDDSSLLANTGGLLGLYLGISVVSLIEIFYHFTIKLLFERTVSGQYIVVQKLKSWRKKLIQQNDETNDMQSSSVSRQKSNVKPKENDEIFIIKKIQPRKIYG